MKRIPTLDGWRGIAILLVLFDHVQDSLLGRYVFPWTRTGFHGVSIFFVLSGFLITSKLLREQMDGALPLRVFYTRRFFRLMPAAWLFLAVLLIFSILIHTHWASATSVLACVLFVRNLVRLPGGADGHFWSLSIEEQFYLVWPGALLALGIRKGRLFAITAAVACSIYRYFAWSAAQNPASEFGTQFHADSLLVGCVLALLLADPQANVRLREFVRILWIPAGLVLLLCIAMFHVAIPLMENLAVAVLICSTALFPSAIRSRVLLWRPLVWIGTISYSIYLWQELFMAMRNPYAVAIGMPLFSVGSYYLVEKPCVSFGHRITSRWKKSAVQFSAGPVEGFEVEG